MRRDFFGQCDCGYSSNDGMYYTCPDCGEECELDEAYQVNPEDDWDSLNNRRADLIERSVDGEITEDEQEELEGYCACGDPGCPCDCEGRPEDCACLVSNPICLTCKKNNCPCGCEDNPDVCVCENI